MLAMRHAEAKSPTLQLFSNSSQIFSATSTRFPPYSSFSLFLLSSPLRLQLLRIYSNQSNRRIEPRGARPGLAWPGRTQDHAAELGGVSEKAQPDSAKWDASILQRPFWARDVNRDDRDEAKSSYDFLELASVTQECDLHLSSSGIVTLPDSYLFTFLTDS